ncbi:hypothetical protein HPB51_006287 [Rhipicephalus microplus]|uniref:Serine/threonine-protein kinase PLK n=1 Tax=Rhipicephalus microplus TaxID=6941 RepID=A0A9J6ELY6_RHIMP|nr:hypothetical protein HPB51_006287 [Rhipicephalus microplus]
MSAVLEPPVTTRVRAQHVVDNECYIVDPETRVTYRKGKLLGKGGFARVHELVDVRTQQVYAGKIIPRCQILREIDLHRPLVNKHVVRLHDFFGDAENIYIILEYCSRKSLVHLLKQRGGQLPETEVALLMRQLAEGVRYTHSQGVVHRDLKLGNMLLDENMELKIADFGLAARVADEPPRQAVCGTPNYLAPEVLRMEGHGFAADVWAMGCIMYALLVGRPPFETSTLTETYQRILRGAYTLPPGLSDVARSLLVSLLQPEPQERPSLNEVLEHPFLRPPREQSGQLLGMLSRLRIDQPAANASRSTTRTSGHSGVQGSARDSPVPLGDCGLLGTLGRVLCPDKREHAYAKSFAEEYDEKLHSFQRFILNLRRNNGYLLGQIGNADQTPLYFDMPGTTTVEKKGAKQVRVLTSVHGSSKLGTTQLLHRLLQACLDEMPTSNCGVPPPWAGSALLVTKWIDYSNKFGFGFQLSDRTVGVLFNDATHLSFSADRLRLEYRDSQGSMEAHAPSGLPPSLQEKYGLLKYFAHYMEENLTEGGDVPKGSGRKKKPLVYLQRWMRTDRAVVMQLSCSMLQVNFFGDHTKLVLSAERTERPLVLYIDERRRTVAYTLAAIARFGCDEALQERLRFALGALQEFAELEQRDPRRNA